jgi:ATP-binding cassette, subfamily B, bacterial
MFALFNQLQSLASDLLLTYVNEKLVLRLPGKFLLHLQQLSLAYHDAKGSSDSVYRLQLDISTLVYYILGSIIP